MGGRGGDCICLGCGRRIHHHAGVRCIEERCPHCGKALVREGSAHHRAYLEKREKAKSTP
jgi:predicted amidophosphoribosyltransferase